MSVDIGDSVSYWTPEREEVMALVTRAYSPSHGTDPSVNLVFVSPDENSTDQYGRQIKRATSVPHQSNQHAPGNFWCK
jgi:hypothetical protein